MERLHGNGKQNDDASNPRSKKSNKTSKGKKNPIKIKYISSPMMVRANNASEFRAIVQELTGQNSVVSDDMSDDFAGPEYDDQYHREDQINLDRPRADQVDRTVCVDDEHCDNSLASFDDEATNFWRSEVVSEQSFNGGFQYPCLLV